LHELEQQKQQQLTLIWQSEQQKRNLEAHLQKARLQQQQAEETQLEARLSSDVEKQSQQEHGQIKDRLGHQAERKDNTVNEQGTRGAQAAHMDTGHPDVNPEVSELDFCCRP